MTDHPSPEDAIRVRLSALVDEALEQYDAGFAVNVDRSLDALAAALAEHEGVEGPPVALEWQGWRQWAKAIQAEVAALRTEREEARALLRRAQEWTRRSDCIAGDGCVHCDISAFLARTDTGGQE